MLQASQNVCNASTSSSVTGNVVVISGNVQNVVTGNAFARGANATCSMNNSVKSQVTNVIQDTINNSTSATTGILGTLLTYQTTNDSTDIEQSVVNNISQILSNTCQATTMADVSQNYQFFQTSSASSGNFIGYNAVSSQVSASCSMQNTSKIVTYNQTSNKVSNVEKYSTIGAIFAAVAAVVFVLVAVAAVGGGLYLFFFKKSPPPGKNADKEGDIIDAPDTFTVSPPSPDIEMSDISNLAFE